jgi:hypothetical protein
MMTSEKATGYDHWCVLVEAFTNEGILNPEKGEEVSPGGLFTQIEIQASPISLSDPRARLLLRYRARVGFLFLIRQLLRYADS